MYNESSICNLMAIQTLYNDTATDCPISEWDRQYRIEIQKGTENTESNISREPKIS